MKATLPDYHEDKITVLGYINIVTLINTRGPNTYMGGMHLCMYKKTEINTGFKLLGQA